MAKNIKNSAREARAKKMELVKEKNYQETMKKLKLKKEEDAERKKANKAKLEVIIFFFLFRCFFFLQRLGDVEGYKKFYFFCVRRNKLNRLIVI